MKDFRSQVLIPFWVGILIITLGCLENEQTIDKDKTSLTTLEGILFKKPVKGPIKFYQSPDGAVSLLYGDNILYFFDESGENVGKHEIEGLVYEVSFSENNYIPVGTQDRPVIYLFSGSGVLKWKKMLDGNINALSISGNGETIVAGFGYPNTRVRFYDSEGKQRWEFVYEKIGSKINSISISRNGDFVALGSSYKDTNLYFFKGEELLWKFQPVSPGLPENGINTVKIIGPGGYIFINAVGDCPPHKLSCGKGHYLDKNGRLIWKNESYSSNDIVLFGESFALIKEREVLIFDKSGELMAAFTGSSRVLDRSVKNNYLIVGLEEGKIVNLDENGFEIWSFNSKELKDLVKIILDEDYIIVVSRFNVHILDQGGSKKWDYLSSRWYLENKLRIKISGASIEDDHINIFGISDGVFYSLRLKFT